MNSGTKKRLYIDQEICDRCPECVIKCSYFYHPNNNGITTLRELAKYAIYCRRCELGTCVQACPQDALEKPKDELLRRYNMRCIGCKSCGIACPFGTILPELLPYILNQCDYCIDRSNGRLPDCVPTCPYNALRFEEIEEDKAKNIYKINDHLIVRSIQWTRI